MALALFRNESESAFLDGLGPEPLGNAFNAAEMDKILAKI